MTTQTFAEAIAEYVQRCQEFLGKEREEGVPPGAGTPYPQDGPPYEGAARFDPEVIRRYALVTGDPNPLYTDPSYGARTRYGSQIAPGLALTMVRSAGGQGPTRPQGYPVGDFFSGTAWEFYGVLRVGEARLRSDKVTREFLDKGGTRGRLLFLIEELNYWDAHQDLLAKCYGTLIMVPTESMGAGRAMNVEKLGEKLMYERKASQYSPEQTREYVSMLEGEQRRGAEPLYWEDVEVGDKLGPVVIPPFTLNDQLSFFSVFSGLTGSHSSNGDETAFEPQYRHLRAGKSSYGGGFQHPITRWPWGPGDEHTDALMAAYRGQAMPFDAGPHRTQIAHRAVSDWMGDDGFIRRYQTALRRPVYYSDTTVYRGEVVKKFTEVQKGDSKPGGVPGTHEYHAVGVRIEGTNQVGQTQLQGTAAVYLPSRAGGPVQLPVPHPAKPPYVPYETFYRDWF